MLLLEKAQVTKIIFERKDIQQLDIRLNEGTCRQAICYLKLTGAVSVGDEVIVNTVANDLKLGSGGKDFVVINLSDPTKKIGHGEPGHIMKLRYTPFQFSVLAAEEEQSQYHEQLKEADSIEGMPVIVGSVHSMLAPAALGIKQQNSNLRITYIMTDGGALPLSLSNTVAQLAENRIIDATITYGNAFGGDYETVNIYTALLLARHCLKAQVAIVVMGPGIVGTGTKWGFSGIEQGEIINAVTALKGRPIAIPRIMFKDPRQRHEGISHHTITVLRHICRGKCIVSLPKMQGENRQLIYTQIIEHNLAEKHTYRVSHGMKIIPIANKLGIPLSVMGKTAEDEPYYFAAAGAAGQIAAQLINEGCS
ncbi:hypothetical protein GGQ84_001059 [Desulfitispora alkaliphila]|uniref:DUF3866 family protein n=1 Tax=Desulfitispora alkaliphila TaxID=622674 RepID=UPI003D218AB7